MNKPYHWTKQEAGFYTLDDTDYGVASMNVTLEDGMTWGATKEWAVVKGATPNDHNAGDNVDWFPTMREAKAAAEGLATR